MKNQITLLFAGGLLAANAVMAAPATAQTGATFYGGSGYIAILQGRGYFDYAQYKSANGIDPQDAKAYFDRGVDKYESGDKKGATAEDGAQASLTTIVPSASILNLPKLIPIGVMLNLT